MKAVQFDDYGGIEVLEVRDVARPEPGFGQVLVAVRAAGINPSEAAIRAGVVREIFPRGFLAARGRRSQSTTGVTLENKENASPTTHKSQAESTSSTIRTEAVNI